MHMLRHVSRHTSTYVQQQMAQQLQAQRFAAQQQLDAAAQLGMQQAVQLVPTKFTNGLLVLLIELLRTGWTETRPMAARHAAGGRHGQQQISSIYRSFITAVLQTRNVRFDVPSRQSESNHCQRLCIFTNYLEPVMCVYVYITTCTSYTQVLVAVAMHCKVYRIEFYAC